MDLPAQRLLVVCAEQKGPPDKTKNHIHFIKPHQFNLIHCNGTLKELHGNKWNAEGFLSSWCKCCSYFFTSSNFCFSFVFGYGIIC